MIVLDTNILIEILKGDRRTIDKIESFTEPLSVSSITVMELYFGALNKAELNKLEKFVSLFRIIHLDEKISRKATKLIRRYAKSHTLDIPDSLIASTALLYDAMLMTYNKKDFRYIEGLQIL